MKKSARGSEKLTTAFLQCSSLHSTGVKQTEDIKTDRQQVEKEIQIHTGNKCLECGKQFTHKGNINKRRKIYTGETCCCNECGKHFPKIKNLNKHSEIHSGEEKPHCCEESGKLFSRSSHLEDHRSIHTGDKPHCCPECGKSFSSRSYLQKHRKIHTEEKPHCCPECGKSFSMRSSLKKHRRIHTGEKPRYCPRILPNIFLTNAVFKGTQKLILERSHIVVLNVEKGFKH
ncbi:gastrula zinc finger protein XlCGF67.1-like [Polypterus senegalus]|uniref:gastrula zinc finger protein XlCGF67.1-like n=1 Tax=Polypterus senegalus TaxID=55291 RepID=UPI0019663E7E|nr:gastrula zinc finger protein XlCGF67.1-like [Polypterus senegalus]